MHILVINSWSSSLKFKLFDMDTQKAIIQWIVEKIWLDGSFLEYQIKKSTKHIDCQVANHDQALHEVFKILNSGVSALQRFSVSSLYAIGHRVVHGGEEITQPVVINENTIEIIKKNSDLAPLHNPANLDWILACQKEAPGMHQVAVFDTAFHSSMKEDHYLYALPYEYYEKYKIRRYGFHGTSHEYVYQRLLEMLSAKCWMLSKDYLTLNTKNLTLPKVITCHLWNWASVTAIKDGRVVETSMGLTPTEWLMMGTRSWNVDPGAITYLMKKENLSPDQMEEIFDKKSWLLWVSWTSSDMRDIIEWYKKGEKKSILTMNMYLNSVVKYIGSYVALLGGCDHIVLTAGIGERSDFFRNLLLERLAWLNIWIDEKKNISSKKEKLITTRKSKIKVRVIPTDEEYMIAKKTMEILSKTK
jgi:acetate kinase